MYKPACYILLYRNKSTTHGQGGFFHGDSDTHLLSLLVDITP